jgi:[protein-PII] uridylyltransferase
VRNTWDRESLRELFLLTLADVLTTSTKAVTNWKLGMLNALFRSSDAFLAGDAGGSLSGRAERVRESVRTLWTDNDPKSLVDLGGFLESMPERYFLANTPEEVMAHAQLALKGGDESVSISWMPSSHDGVLGLCVVAEPNRGLDLCVVAGDRPGLLASITAAISANHFDIQAAQINSRPLSGGGHQAVDLFWVRSPADEATKERRLASLKRDIASLVRGDVQGEVLIEPMVASSRSGRPTPAVVTEVLFDHHASDEYTVIEVLAEDRPALLFTLSSTLRGLGIVIGVAKISTEGTRAVDVLYACESDGSKIAAGARADEVQARLLWALGAPIA